MSQLPSTSPLMTRYWMALPAAPDTPRFTSRHNVGDSGGLLHKFTGVFKDGATPQEIVILGSWPACVYTYNPGPNTCTNPGGIVSALQAAVFDPTSGLVLAANNNPAGAGMLF